MQVRHSGLIEYLQLFIIDRIKALQRMILSVAQCDFQRYWRNQTMLGQRINELRCRRVAEVDALEHRCQAIEVFRISSKLEEEWLPIGFTDTGMVHVDGNHTGRLSSVRLAVYGNHQRASLNQHGDVLAVPLLIVNEEILPLLKSEEGNGLESVLLWIFVKHEREVALQRTHLTCVNRREHDPIRAAGGLFYPHLRMLNIV